jgi:CO/xanthine dehydrogenase FAD-binding subunit
VRANVPAYDLRAPRSLDEALALLRDGEWRPFAGGTDLMVQLETGRLAHRKFVSIWGLPELRGIEVGDGHVTLGALTTFTDVLRNEVLRREFPMLGAAAGETGAVAIQNRGTIGGNIANASPAADTPPALLAYEAEVELVSAAEGARWVAYDGFHLGYKKTVMRPDELIRRVRVTRPAAGSRTVEHYRKVGTRRAQAIAKVVFAGLARLGADGALADVRISLGSVAPVTVRCKKTEDLLRGRRPDAATIAAARAALRGEIAPIDDIRSTAAYRGRVSENLLAEFLEKSTRT